MVVQEAFGVNAHIRDVADRFAQAGYRAVAPHLFYRTGDPEHPYDNFEAVLPHMQALSGRGISDDLEATFGYLTDAGFESDRVGIVGFCMGGSVAFYAATQFPLGAAVTFYGGGITEGRMGMPALVDVAAHLKCPWLGLFGDQDPSIPVDHVEALRQAVAKAPVSTEIVRYPEAGHGFHCDERPANYHAQSATDAWQRTLSWFQDHLGR
ncbi:MAG: dienelactone hydrolase family protein [Mycobacteriales bacterium]